MPKWNILCILLLIVISLNADIISNLELKYTFDGNANDSSGKNRNGTVVNAVLTTDRFGNASQAYRFNGNAYINTNTDLSWGYSSSFSMSMWFKTDNFYADQVLLSKTNYEYSLKIGGLWTNDNFLNFEYWNTGGGGGIGLFYSQNQLQNNTWYHTAVTYDAATHISILYINGQEIQRSTAANTTFRDLAETMLLGYGYHWQGENRYFTGSMDDVMVYSRNLSVGDVQQLAAIPEISNIVIFSLGLFLISFYILSHLRVKSRVKM